LPSGTITFLFTDIEGSTQRWESHREAMKLAVARHEQLVAGAMEKHGGYVFKAMGDALCVAFPTAPNAVRAAIDAQAAVAKEDFSAVEGLRVRMGLHTGYAEERNGDYFGPAVNRVARLMAIGHGGQVLLSAVTKELAHGDLPTSASLINLGSQRLRDLTEPEQVWQLAISGLANEFPPLRSLDTLPNNLPVQVTSFRGRDQDLEELKNLIEHHPLVTLVGSGGVGKTRLALQTGAELLDRFSDGVWLADLATITDPELVSSVVAKVLGMSQQETERVDESLPVWLRRKHLLLILDNCEHVLEATAKLAEAIIRSCPEVRVLSTSRQALGIRGEEVFRVSSLDVPHRVTDCTPETAIGFGAVALFVDRARSVDRSFELTADSAPIVADICRRLDGIPLAIELAAARVKVLSIPNLAQRLNERFKLLTGGSRDAVPRQRTLSALIDWSYDLLSPQEQKLFTRAGIFSGGFSLDAATAVCGEGMDEIDILDLLASLSDKSLLVADTGGEQERYHLLESTRAYALGKLTPDERTELSRRHAEYFRDLVQAADERYGVGSTSTWLESAELELDNYRAALEWTITENHDLVIGGAIAGALEQVWYRGGLAKEGLYWISAALDRGDYHAHPLVAARLWRAIGFIRTGKPAFEAAERAYKLYDAAGDARAAARARSDAAFALVRMGRVDEAEGLLATALETTRSLGDTFGVLLCLATLGSIQYNRGEFKEGREIFSQALRLSKELANDMQTYFVLANLAELEFADGNPAEALRQSEDLLNSGRTVNPVNLAVRACNIAAYSIALGQLDRAHDSARQSLRIGRSAALIYNISIACQHLAHIAALRGKPHLAASLLGFVDEQYRKIEAKRETTEQWCYDKFMAALREQLGEAEIQELLAEGARWTEDHAIEVALEL
jgi:predicted ATPase/class 3 adenylate cyclase